MVGLKAIFIGDSESRLERATISFRSGAEFRVGIVRPLTAVLGRFRRQMLP
jgi:hypothetical protein